MVPARRFLTVFLIALLVRTTTRPHTHPAVSLSTPKVTEVQLPQRAASGRMLMARVYQPQGVGPFPTLLDLDQAGPWKYKDRGANQPMHRAVAASGVLVVAIDLTLAPEAPYPASVQDGNYGVRWLEVEGRRLEWRGREPRRTR